MKKLEKQSLYKVQAILDKKIDDNGNVLYLIKWKNWPSSSNTWEPYKNVSTVKNLIQQFEEKGANRPVKRKPGRPPKIKREQDQSNKIIIVNGAKRQIKIPSQSVIQGPRPNIIVSEIAEQTLQKKKELRRKGRNKRKPIHKTSVNQRRRVKTLQQSLQNIHIISDEQSNIRPHCEQQIQQLDLQQVLLTCENYKQVKISFKEKKFYYQIPYWSNGCRETFTTTAEQIIKVNPKWLSQYFQGFYL